MKLTTHTGLSALCYFVLDHVLVRRRSWWRVIRLEWTTMRRMGRYIR